MAKLTLGASGWFSAPSQRVLVGVFWGHALGSLVLLSLQLPWFLGMQLEWLKKNALDRTRLEHRMPSWNTQNKDREIHHKLVVRVAVLLMMRRMMTMMIINDYDDGHRPWSYVEVLIGTELSVRRCLGQQTTTNQGKKRAANFWLPGFNNQRFGFKVRTDSWVKCLDFNPPKEAQHL